MPRAKKNLLNDEEVMLVRFGWKIVTSGKRRYVDPRDKKDYPLTMAVIIFTDRQQKIREERDAYWAKVLETLDTDDEETFERMFPPVEKGDASNAKKRQSTVHVGSGKTSEREARTKASGSRARPAKKPDGRTRSVRPAGEPSKGKPRKAGKRPKSRKGQRARLP